MKVASSSFPRFARALTVIPVLSSLMNTSAEAFDLLRTLDNLALDTAGIHGV